MQPASRITCNIIHALPQGYPGLSVLQLRRFLRAIGQPTVGLKPALTARLEEALSSGAVKAYVDGTEERQREVVECGKDIRAYFIYYMAPYRGFRKRREFSFSLPWNSSVWPFRAHFPTWMNCRQRVCPRPALILHYFVLWVPAVTSTPNRQP